MILKNPIMKVQGKYPGSQIKSKIRIFEIFGIRLLNRFIMATIGNAVLKVNPREKMPSYFVGHPFNIKSLLLTQKWLLFNEVVHLFLIFLSAAIGYFFLEKGYGMGVIIIVLVIILNFILILMQWMNRIRIRGIISAINKREHLSGNK